ncbi:MAG: CHAT domain-containing protein [Acidobacteria bacterium]|nr:CHAT domain-containing protein [Acidobacteriota bacterium]
MSLPVEQRAAFITAHPELLDRKTIEAMNLIGGDFRDKNALAQAEKYYEPVLWIGRTLKLPRYEAIGLNNMGIVAGVRGNRRESQALLEEALAVATANGDRETVQSTWANLGILQRRGGDLDAALASQLRALSLARELGKLDAVARTLNNLGNVLHDQGAGARALDAYIESLAIKEQAKSTVSDLVSTTSNIGMVYAEQGDYALAIEYYRRAISLVERDGAGTGAATAAFNNLGQAYLSVGDHALARTNLARALEIAERSGDPSRIATVLYILGNVARDERKLDEAEALQRRSLAMRENGGEVKGYIEGLTEMANLLDRRGKTAEGLPYGERAVQLATDTRLLNELWKAQLTLATSHDHLGHVAEARAAYQASIDTIETLRQVAAGGDRAKRIFLAERMGPYFGLATLDARAGRTFDALSLVDRARARTLIDIIATGRQPTRQLTEAQRAGERQVTQAVITASNLVDAAIRQPKPDAARLAEANRVLVQARITRDAYIGELYNQQPDLQFARGNTPELTRERLAAVLPAGTAIVTFVLEQRQTWAYVATRGADGAPQVATVALTMATGDVMSLAERFAEQIAARDLAFADNARKLYDGLLGAADPLLAGAAHVIIIPDGPLWQVPFQALRTPRGKFMIEEHAVSYTPSITALAALEDRRQRRATATPYLVALGDPDTAISTPSAAAPAMRAGTQRLPEAAREVKSLGELYGTTRSSVFVAADARESILRDQVTRASVLHVATHGVLDDRNPMYSHLLLTPGDARGKIDPGEHTTDGRLEAWEVLDMGITADLAVLSACKTARGGNTWGEGVIGLSWSLFASGVSTAVVSQWEVDSSSTTALMIAFHRRRLSTGAKAGGVPEALRQAALELLKNPAHRHPFYWAGFISIGAK